MANKLNGNVVQSASDVPGSRLYPVKQPRHLIDNFASQNSGQTQDTASFMPISGIHANMHHDNSATKDKEFSNLLNTTADKSTILGDNPNLCSSSFDPRTAGAANKGGQHSSISLQRKTMNG